MLENKKLRKIEFAGFTYLFFAFGGMVNSVTLLRLLLIVPSVLLLWFVSLGINAPGNGGLSLLKRKALVRVAVEDKHPPRRANLYVWRNKRDATLRFLWLSALQAVHDDPFLTNEKTYYFFLSFSGCAVRLWPEIGNSAHSFQWPFLLPRQWRNFYLQCFS